jgi:aquaporin Z
MAKYLVEFIGTFFLVATIGFTTVSPNDAGPMAPLAIGAVLMVMIFAGGHISGAHYNPAVTLAVWLRGRCSTIDAGLYVAAQLVGAVAASLVVLYLKDKQPNFSTGAELPDAGKALIAELLFTFALCYVVLNVATAKKTDGNSYFGLAIGFTVLAGAYSVGPISKGAFNPAVAVALINYGAVGLKSIWALLAGELIGGAAAAFVFRFLHPDEK